MHPILSKYNAHILVIALHIILHVINTFIRIEIPEWLMIAFDCNLSLDIFTPCKCINICILPLDVLSGCISVEL